MRQTLSPALSGWGGICGDPRIFTVTKPGRLRALVIAERYPLEQAGMSYVRVESGEAPGRVLLLMG